MGTTHNPSPDNPVVMFLKSADINADILEHRSRVTAQVIRNLQHGLFNSIPPAVASALQELGAPRTIELDYKEWVRSDIKDVILPYEHTGFPVGLAFLDWKHKFLMQNDLPITTMAFCRKLRLQPTIVTNWETGLTASFPRLLEDRLRQAGADAGYLETLRNLPPR